MISDFHFLRPWWWLALIGLPVLWQLLRSDSGAQRSWARSVDAHLLPHLLVAGGSAQRLPWLLVCSAWLVAVAALAGPSWERLPTPLYRNHAARVIALELSPSMLAADLKPNRLTRARFAIHALLQQLGDGQVALLGYAGDAFVVAPMTDDAATVRNLLDALDPGVMPVAGNATSLAIRRAVSLIQQAGERGGELILVADSADGDAAAAARAAAAAGVRVSVLALGTAAGAPVSLPQGDFWKDSNGNIVVARLDAQALRGVATAGGGEFVELGAAATAEIPGLLSRPALHSGNEADGAAAQSAAWRDRGPWLALLLIPLALLGFRRGWLLLVLLALGVATERPAQAMGWSDLWQRSDQRAWQALQAGDAAQAAVLARDAELRGAATFRAGDPAAAAQEWARSDTADAAYNRGNALAQQQQYQEAIAAWDEALRRDPQHADARSNKQAVEEWLRQQPPSPQKSPSDGESSKSGKQDPSSSPGQQGQGKDGQSAGDQKQNDPSAQDQPADAAQSGDDASSQASPDQGSGGSDGQGDGKRSDSSAADSTAAHGEGSDAQDGSEAGKPGGKETTTTRASTPGTPNGADRAAGEPLPQASPSGGDARQQQAFRQAMDKALDKGTAAAPAGSAATPVDASSGASVPPIETPAQREQRQAIENWLQRVPDDPGGLLRRKFQLEYERRQQGARGGEK